MLIEHIAQEKSILSIDYKLKIFEWILYSKLRSPVWRNHISQHLFDTNMDFNSEIRELHMSFFKDSDLFRYFTDLYIEELTIKKWRILVSPEEKGWLTTDSPGIMINLKEFAKSPDDYLPNALWNNIQYDSAFYFPLTSKYCLEICPYDDQDDVKRNLGSDSIDFIKPIEDMYHQINFWTMHSASEILISKYESDLYYYKEILSK